MGDVGTETANKSTTLWEETQRSGVVAVEGYGVKEGFLHKGRPLGMFIANGNNLREGGVDGAGERKVLSRQWDINSRAQDKGCPRGHLSCL